MDDRGDRHWHALPIPLAWVCAQDEHPAPNALTDALGDRYLYFRNPVFAQVRDAALSFGYRFTVENTHLWRDYQVFSLTTLHRILADRAIPYFDTLTTINRLLAQNPKASVAPGFLLGNLKANHAFHESAHAVAHAILEQPGCDLRGIMPDEKVQFVLKALLAEAFANTMERFGSIFRHKQVSDTLFYALNSYVLPRDATARALRVASEVLGLRRCLALLFLASFEANLAVGKPSEDVYERVSGVAGCLTSEQQSARGVIGVGFDLNGGFRENTTPMYFGLLGYRKEYLSLRNSRWLESLAHAQFALGLAEKLFDICGRDMTLLTEVST